MWSQWRLARLSCGRSGDSGRSGDLGHSFGCTWLQLRFHVASFADCSEVRGPSKRSRGQYRDIVKGRYGDRDRVEGRDRDRDRDRARDRDKDRYRYLERGRGICRDRDRDRYRDRD